MSQSAPQPTRSKLKIIFGWVFTVSSIVIGCIIGFSAASRGHSNSYQPVGFGFSILIFLFGAFSLVVGLIGYFIVVLTECFTFNYQQPVWGGVKVRLYAANIFIPLFVMMGIGFMVGAIVTPLLSGLGLRGAVAYMIPLIGTLVAMQIVLVWVSLWTPLTKRLIQKRLRAKGLTGAQLATGEMVGISDANRSSFKKFFMIEDDVGMMWFDPAQIIYWGDNEQFAIRHEQLLDVERSMDAGSTSAMGGTVHVILRVAQADGGQRRIRLHNEGIWTMGRRRVAMDELAGKVESWRSARPVSQVP